MPLLARRQPATASVGNAGVACYRLGHNERAGQRAMPTIEASALQALSFRIARAMGSEEGEAREVARHLVAANLAGHDSHGVGMLPTYVRCLKEGLLVPNQTLTLESDRGGMLVFDAKRGFGAQMARAAVTAGIARARENGAVVVALKNSCHIGRIGTYGELCAEAGMASVHFVNVADHDAVQAPFGCSDARLGTNPFCAAVPGSDGPAAMLDMATSTIAFGKARVARNKGVPVPEGALIDADGRPTTDPTQMIDERRGALTSFGGHKGSGMAIMCEMLGAAMTGGHTIVDEMRHAVINNMLSTIIDTASFGPLGQTVAKFGAVGDWIKASPPAPGFDKVRLPGEPEREARTKRLAEGIPVDERSLAEILDAGASLGTPRAEFAALVGA